MNNFFIKTNRIFNPIRKYAWIYTLLVAVGGLWYPRLGLSVLLIILALTGLAFFKGRYWCGNFCPHGSYFDKFLNPISANRKIPAIFGSKVLIAIFFILFSMKIIKGLIRVSALWGTALFWDKLGYIFVSSYLMVVIVGSILSIFVSQRTWCHFCPMGTLQRLSYKLGKLLGVARHTDQKISISNNQLCHLCGKCSRVCPMQLTPYLDFLDQEQFDNEICIRCSTCVENCPAGILTLNQEKEALKVSEVTSIAGYENRQVIKARLEKITELDDNTREYSFKFIKPKIVNYQAGQFILVKIQDDPMMYRAFSISSYDHEASKLKVTVNKVADGYGTGIIFDEFKEGDRVQLEGPMGNELIVDTKAKKLLFIAGGIGITPFVPMVQEIIENDEFKGNAELIYGVNYQKDLIYNDYFEGLAVSKQFRYTKVVAFDDKWQGNKGFVTDVIQDRDLEGYQVYMCGPEPMIDATLQALEKKGVKDEDIFYESA